MSTETAIFGGGCFWCTEAVFQRLKGVTSVTPGYAGGTMANPTYEHVSSGATGHAEVIKVEFDPDVVSYRTLLSVFFAVHDPTSLNRQGADEGTEYRSIILYTSEKQKSEAEEAIGKVNNSRIFPKPVVTEIKKLDMFYTAEEYHKNFYNNNRYQPYCQIVVSPKIDKLKEQFAELLKKD